MCMDYFFFLLMCELLIYEKEVCHECCVLCFEDLSPTSQSNVSSYYYL